MERHGPRRPTCARTTPGIAKAAPRDHLRRFLLKAAVHRSQSLALERHLRKRLCRPTSANGPAVASNVADEDGRQVIVQNTTQRAANGMGRRNALVFSKRNPLLSHAYFSRVLRAPHGQSGDHTNVARTVSCALRKTKLYRLQNAQSIN